MKLFGYTFGRERKSTGLDFLREIFEAPTFSGRSITHKNALQVSTVFACVRVISEGIAQIPLKILKKSEGGRIHLDAADHPLSMIFRRRPNAWQTPFEFRELMAVHLVLTGNFFAFINRVNGHVLELLPIDPGSVKVQRMDDWSIEYTVSSLKNGSKTFGQEDIWHIRGISWNSYLGMDATKIARESIGLAAATEEHHARLHAHGARPGGLLTVDGTLTESQYKQLKDWLKNNFEGANNAWRTMVMDRGAKFSTLTMSGVDAEHLATRRFQIEEVCRAFRVNPIMVGYSDKATTYASAEAMMQGHVTNTLLPWYARIEESINSSLITDREAESGVYAKFFPSGLMRGNAVARGQFYNMGVGMGWLTRNEVRALEDLNPIEGLDEPLTPLNMASGVPSIPLLADGVTHAQNA